MAANNSAARDRLWQATFETYYECYHHEIVADGLIDRWQRVDDVTKVLASMFASGTVVAGWALWNTPRMRAVWVLLAGFTTVLSIAHGALGVATRVRDWVETKRRFGTCRLELETLMYRMQVDSEFDVPEFTREFVERREQYAQGIHGLKNDTLLTDRLRNKAQDALNDRIRAKIMDQTQEPLDE